MAFRLPDLGYEYTALEPHIDARTMAIHHSKHHSTYVGGLNAGEPAGCPAPPPSPPYQPPPAPRCAFVVWLTGQPALAANSCGEGRVTLGPQSR